MYILLPLLYKVPTWTFSKGGENEVAILLKLEVFFQVLARKMREKLHLLLGSISPRGNKRKNEFLHSAFVVDVPVVPAGTIVLKYSITSVLFWDLALLARHRIHRCVFSTGFFRSAGVNFRHSWNRTTISLGSFDWVWMHWRTSLGRTRDSSESYSNMFKSPLL